MDDHCGAGLVSIFVKLERGREKRGRLGLSCFIMLCPHIYTIFWSVSCSVPWTLPMGFLLECCCYCCYRYCWFFSLSLRCVPFLFLSFSLSLLVPGLNVIHSRFFLLLCSPLFSPGHHHTCKTADQVIGLFDAVLRAVSRAV